MLKRASLAIHGILLSMTFRDPALTPTVCIQTGFQNWLEFASIYQYNPDCPPTESVRLSIFIVLTFIAIYHADYTKKFQCINLLLNGGLIQKRCEWIAKLYIIVLYNAAL